MLFNHVTDNTEQINVKAAQHNPAHISKHQGYILFGDMHENQSLDQVPPWPFTDNTGS
jgi:hypothetical protein